MANTRRLICPAILVALCAIIIVQRLLTYNEPLERDITSYAVTGNELLHGRCLYSDLWDHKPPAIHAAYAAATVLVGYGPQCVFLLNITCAILVLLGVYYAASAAGFGPAAGLSAAACWTIVSADLGLEANEPNTELFINVCLVWAFAILVSAHGSSLRSRSLLLVAVLFSAASLFKPLAIVPAGMMGAAHVGLAPRDTRGKAIAHVLMMLGLVVAAWGVVAAYFAATGRFQAFNDAVFTYNGFYGGSVIRNLGRSFGLRRLFPHAFLPVQLVLGALTAAGVAYRMRHTPRYGVFMIAAMVATYVQVALPGRFFPHYYQLWLPVLSIGAGIGMVSLMARPRWQFVAACLALCALCVYEWSAFALSPDEWSQRKYGTVFVESRNLGRELDAALKAGETFYEWGSESGLYFYSGRRPQTGVFFNYPLIGGPLVDKLTPRVLADLDRRQPELFIIHQAYAFSGPISKWFSTRYQLFPDRPVRGEFVIYARRGGRLANWPPPDRSTDQPKQAKRIGL